MFLGYLLYLNNSSPITYQVVKGSIEVLIAYIGIYRGITTSIIIMCYWIGLHNVFLLFYRGSIVVVNNPAVVICNRERKRDPP